MLKRLAALLSLAFLAALPASAAVTLSVDAGLLTDQNGNPISDGGGNPLNADLILVLASPTGVFSPTVGSSFISGDNLILASTNGTGTVTGALSMSDSLSGVSGETINQFAFNYGVGATGDTVLTEPSVQAGDKLAIRWYTDFTLAQFLAGNTPTAGYYGTYTTSLVLPNNDGGAAWVAPTDPGFYSGSNGLFFFTTSDMGDQSNLLGEALTPVVSGQVAVPEPSTYALLAMGLLVCAGVARRKAARVSVK